MPHEIYSDASFDAATKRGVGACLVLLQGPLAKATEAAGTLPFTQEFPVASCARMELVAVLWALDLFEKCLFDNGERSLAAVDAAAIVLYTDSKTVAELHKRRVKLEAKDFTSGRTGGKLSNGDLYQKFFAIVDRLSLNAALEVVWLKGHTPKALRTRQHKLFATVDQAARAGLRGRRQSSPSDD